MSFLHLHCVPRAQEPFLFSNFLYTMLLGMLSRACLCTLKTHPQRLRHWGALGGEPQRIESEWQRLKHCGCLRNQPKTLCNETINWHQVACLFGKAHQAHWASLTCYVVDLNAVECCRQSRCFIAIQALAILSGNPFNSTYTPEICRIWRSCELTTTVFRWGALTLSISRHYLSLWNAWHWIQETIYANSSLFCD